MAQLPTPADLGNRLRDLFDRPVQVKLSATKLEAAKSAATSYMIHADKTPAVLAYADLRFAAHAGAALGLVPMADVNAALKKGALDQTLQENFYEVMNILSAAFAEAGKRVILARVAPSTPEPPEVKEFGKPKRRFDLEVKITGYGDGILAAMI